MAIDYKSAGVDIEVGDQLVEWLKTENGHRPQPHQDKILSGIGGFASLFRFPKDDYEKPCLVSCTDGVGTKLKLGIEFESYEGLGQDLVAMCLNDMICCGADPLFFLDYFATGKLELSQAQAFLKGVREACLSCHCALIGGETAEMPGMYKEKDFDCAGFAVGVVDEAKALGAHRVLASDRVYGVSSTGFHSNGYSLVRKLFAKDLSEWQERLLKPTALYVSLFQKLTARQVDLHALAHITGGGLNNVERVLPKGLSWHRLEWEWPEVFQEAMERSGLSRDEMMATFNCGIGLVIIAPATEASKIEEIVQASGFDFFELGDLHS